MGVIKIEVNGNIARATERPGRITAGTVGQKIEFRFDEEWNGLNKIAVFRGGTVAKDRQIIDGEQMTVPHEVMAVPCDRLVVGVEGRNNDGTIVIPTTYANICTVIGGADASGDSVFENPSPTIYDDIMARIESGILRGPEGPQGPKGDTPVKGVDYHTVEDRDELVDEVTARVLTKARNINIGKLTTDEIVAISNIIPGNCDVSLSAAQQYFAKWAYKQANIDLDNYVGSVSENFSSMFDTTEDAPLGEKYKLENPSVMLLPASYGGNEFMQAHDYRYTMDSSDYKTGDIFCASVKVYSKRGDLIDIYFMAICLNGHTFMAVYNYGDGTPNTVVTATYNTIESIIDSKWPYPGVGAGDPEECFPTYYYVLRPENVAAADAISLGKEFQGFKRETKAGLAECANAIKGTASGEAVALADVSPFEHEMAVKVSQGGATVQKLGKNYALTSSANKPINMGAGSLTVSAKQLESTLKARQTYTLTADISCDNPDKVLLVQSSAYATIGYFRNDGRQSLTFTVGANDYDGLYLYGGKDLATSKLYAATFENITVCEGTPQTYTADENGIVRGIIGNGESMTLLTDTEGVTIEAEYNKDTNKVIESLVQAIISLGGNV